MKNSKTPGQLTLVTERVAYNSVALKWKHLYRCFCGVEFITVGADVKSGRTKSCGCWNRNRKASLVHGLSKTPEHRAWVEMRRRCSDPSRPGFKNYGGRGIKVCDRWSTFENFLIDMGPKPDASLSLDRIDNDKDYGPDNCRWATKTTQSRNQSRHIGKVWDEKAA